VQRTGILKIISKIRGFNFISFASPKETKQRKRARKCQLQPFSPPATQAIASPLHEKRLQFAPFSDSPAHRQNIKSK
jgi:hypothetical protein